MSEALRTWKNKLDYLQQQEAIITDPAQKFAVAEQIREATAKIAELGVTSMRQLEDAAPAAGSPASAGAAVRDHAEQTVDSLTQSLSYVDQLKTKRAVEAAEKFALTLDRSHPARELAIRRLQEFLISSPGFDARTDVSRRLRSQAMNAIVTLTHGVLRPYFRDAEFAGQDLVSMDFQGCNLAEVSFENAFLIRSDFSQANLSGASFRNARIRNVNFGGAKLDGADFSGADWFNAVGLARGQLESVQGPLLPIPRDEPEHLEYLENNYAYSFENYPLEVQEELKRAWVSNGALQATDKTTEENAASSDAIRRQRVYISYSYDSAEHIARVREFAARLKADGIDVRIDTDVGLDPSEGWPAYSQNQIQDADLVILICTETYHRRFDGREQPGRGKGVTFEGRLIRQEIFDSQGRGNKFIPVIFDFRDDSHIPALLRDRGRYVLRDDAEATGALGYSSLLRRLRPAPSPAPLTPRTSSPPKPERTIMATHQFNPNRLAQLEELLDIEYEKLHEFERAISLADGVSQKIALRQQIKRDLTPRLRKLEQEYAELLAQGAPEADISEAQAQTLVNEVASAVTKVNEQKPSNAPQEMVRLLGEIRDKLNEPGKSASAKLKVSLPIIPLIASYEMEMDTEGVLTAAWRKARDFFKGLVKNRPQ